MAKVPGGLWKKYIAVQIYGANTDVGKTVFSTLLGLRFKYGLKLPSSELFFDVKYIKPVSTGPSSDRDDRYVCVRISVDTTDFDEVCGKIPPPISVDIVPVPGTCQSSHSSSRLGKYRK